MYKTVGSPPLNRQIQRFRNSPQNSPSRNSVRSEVSESGRTTSSIRVIARFRPETEQEHNFNKAEPGPNRVGIVEFTSPTSTIIRHRDQSVQFTFDRIFGPQASQQELFDYAVRDTVADVFQGYNGTILAYGQTGSGKTYTMMGNLDDDIQKGLVPRIGNALFDHIMLGSLEIEYTVGVSYMEIYMERLRDLVNPSTPLAMLQIHEDKENGVHVAGLQRVYVTAPEELQGIVRSGTAHRAVAATGMNAASSRSHAILQITVTQRSTESGSVKRGNLFLVDLAGSEKVAKTGASGQTLEEAKKINSSLSALGNVINALSEGKAHHVPYRDSKLTRILQESIGGNSRTSLIVNCSPASLNADETLSTLRFGLRAKKIKNRAYVNTEVSPKELQKSLHQAHAEIRKKDQVLSSIASELQAWRAGTPPDTTNWISIDPYLTSSGILGSSLEEDTEQDTSTSSKLESLKNTSNETLDAGTSATEALRGELDALLRKIEHLESKTSIEIEQKNAELAFVRSQLEAEKLQNTVLRGEVEQLKTKIGKKSLSKNEKQKIAGLERALEVLSKKLEDMSLQNQILKKDISTTRTIAETRVERIRTLELVVRTQQNAVSRESSEFAKRLDVLAARVQIVKKLQEVSNRSAVSLPIISESRFSLGGMASPGTPLFESSFNDARPWDLGETSEVSEGPSSKDQSRINDPKIRASVQLADIGGSSKKGLNLRIVKPLRGGNGGAMKSPEV